MWKRKVLWLQGIRFEGVTVCKYYFYKYSLFTICISQLYQEWLSTFDELLVKESLVLVMSAEFAFYYSHTIKSKRFCILDPKRSTLFKGRALIQQSSLPRLKMEQSGLGSYSNAKNHFSLKNQSMQHFHLCPAALKTQYQSFALTLEKWSESFLHLEFLVLRRSIFY